MTWLLLQTAGVARSETATQAQWQQLDELRGIASNISSGPTTTYIFFDPNCPVSAKLNKSGAGLPGVDLRRAKWIPVAHVQPSSSAKAVALLRAGKYESIVNNYQHFNYAKYEGGIAGITPTDDDKQALEKSKAVWTALTPTPATPMIIYKDKAGVVNVQLGLPSRSTGETQPGMGTYTP